MLNSVGLVVLMLAAGPAVHAGGTDERVPLTDTAVLQALGYPDDARNVYQRGQFGPLQSEQDTDEHVLLGAAPGQNVAWISSTGSEFFPVANAIEYVKGPAFLVANGALASLTAGAFFETQLHLPRNAYWRFLDIAGLHSHASQDLVVAAIERCLPFFGGGNPSETVLQTRTYGSLGGSFFREVAVNHSIDSRLCTYHVRVRLGNAGEPTAPGVAIQVSKVRAQWIPDVIFADGFGSGL